MKIEETLRVLLGEAVNAVCFVMDYVELHFNGPILRCIADPMIYTGEKEYAFPEAGSRDALCALIGDRATAIDAIPGESITLRMASGCSVRVPLDPDHAHQGESAHFVSGINEPIKVW